MPSVAPTGPVLTGIRAMSRAMHGATCCTLVFDRAACLHAARSTTPRPLGRRIVLDPNAVTVFVGGTWTGNAAHESARGEPGHRRRLGRRQFRSGGSVVPPGLIPTMAP